MLANADLADQSKNTAKKFFTITMGVRTDDIQLYLKKKTPFVLTIT